MDNFNELKEVWRQREVSDALPLDNLRKKAADKYVKDQKKLIFVNLFVSICFAGEFIIAGWIWSINPGRSLFFYTSLILIQILLVATLVGLWYGVQYKGEDAYESTVSYLKSQIKKLNFRIMMITRYVPIYLLLMMLFFYMYFADILSETSTAFTVMAYTLLTAFFVISWLISKKKQKKSLQTMIELERDLKEILNEIKG